MITTARIVILALCAMSLPALAQDAPKSEPTTKSDAKKSASPLKIDRQKVSPTIVPSFKIPDLSAANNAYTLTEEEKTIDCKKLTGRVSVGIMQLRRESAAPKTSALSRTMQTAAIPFLAGSTRGINPEGDNARDLSRIRALNGQLTAKNCQPFDVDAELQPGATNTPRPIPKAKPASKAAPTLKFQKLGAPIGAAKSETIIGRLSFLEHF